MAARGRHRGIFWGSALCLCQGPLKQPYPFLQPGTTHFVAGLYLWPVPLPSREPWRSLLLFSSASVVSLFAHKIITCTGFYDLFRERPDSSSVSSGESAQAEDQTLPSLLHGSLHSANKHLHPPFPLVPVPALSHAKVFTGTYRIS